MGGAGPDDHKSNSDKVSSGCVSWIGRSDQDIGDLAYIGVSKVDLHQEVEKIKAWSYSRNCTNDPVILTVSIRLRGYMHNPIT